MNSENGLFGKPNARRPSGRYRKWKWKNINHGEKERNLGGKTSYGLRLQRRSILGGGSKELSGFRKASNYFTTYITSTMSVSSNVLYKKDFYSPSLLYFVSLLLMMAVLQSRNIEHVLGNTRHRLKHMVVIDRPSNNALQCYYTYYFKDFEISMFRATKKTIKTLHILKLTVCASGL
jgi:hypothetical protein